LGKILLYVSIANDFFQPANLAEPLNQCLALRNSQALIATPEGDFPLLHLQAFTFSFYLFVVQKCTRGLTKSDPVRRNPVSCVGYSAERSHLSFCAFCLLIRCS